MHKREFLFSHKIVEVSIWNVPTSHLRRGADTLYNWTDTKTADAGKKEIASNHPLFFLPIACTWTQHYVTPTPLHLYNFIKA